jgi:hypothetical protein
MRGARPGERRGGRKKGTPNKRSIPAIQAAIKQKHPDLDSLSLQRCAAAAILAEIEKVRSQKRYDAKALVDWCVKLARAAKGYAKLDQERPDFAEVRADLSRLNTDQLLALKQLALIASIARQAAGDVSAPVGAPEAAGRPDRVSIRLPRRTAGRSEPVEQPLRGRRPQHPADHRLRHHSRRLAIERHQNATRGCKIAWKSWCGE